jgi:hypothetical protein
MCPGKPKPFPLSNERLDGVTRYTKYRALRELEAEGLITVKRQRKKVPAVTLIRRSSPLCVGRCQASLQHWF